MNKKTRVFASSSLAAAVLLAGPMVTAASANEVTADAGTAVVAPVETLPAVDGAAAEVVPFDNAPVLDAPVLGDPPNFPSVPDVVEPVVEEPVLDAPVVGDPPNFPSTPEVQEPVTEEPVVDVPAADIPAVDVPGENAPVSYDPPVVGADIATTPYGTPVTVDVMGNDSVAPGTTAGDFHFLFDNFGAPVQYLDSGVAAFVGNQVVFTPADGFAGTVNLTYGFTQFDEDGEPQGYGTGTVTINVEAAPVIATPAVPEAPVVTPEVPAVEEPVVEAPVKEAPVKDAPVQVAPVEDTPVVTAPVQDAPVAPVAVQDDVTPVEVPVGAADDAQAVLGGAGPVVTDEVLVDAVVVPSVFADAPADSVPAGGMNAGMNVQTAATADALADTGADATPVAAGGLFALLGAAALWLTGRKRTA